METLLLLFRDIDAIFLLNSSFLNYTRARDG